MASDDSADMRWIVPIQVITIEEMEGRDRSRYVLNKLSLNQILAKVGDRKVALIFNVGKQGEGNSFLLNKIGRHIVNAMRNGVQTSGPADEHDLGYDMGADIEILEDPNDPLKGFEWKTDPNETTTRGIWFSQPFIVRKTGGEEVAIILVDTQGLDGNDCTEQDMSTIVGLSLLSASTLVFNVTNGLKDDVLKRMHLYIDHCLQAVEISTGNVAHRGGEVDNLNPFQNLLFVIRDWARPVPPHTYGLDGGQHYLNTRFDTSAGQREFARNTRQFIRDSFDSIHCYLMPDPGVNARSQQFNGCPNELTDDFNANLRVFCSFLLNPDTIKVKTINGQPITGHEFGRYFEDYVNMFNSESGPRACDLLEATHRAHDLNLINQLKDKYMTKMSTLMDSRPFHGGRQLTTQSHDLINTLESDFGFRKRSTAESVVRELMDQLSRALDAVFRQKKEENEMRRLTATNDKVTELVNEFKLDICDHIRPGDYLSDHTLGKIIDTKIEYIINLFDRFAADHPDRFAEHKRRQMNELFEIEDKFYPEDQLDTLSATILGTINNELTQADVGTEVVPFEPYRQALDTYVRDRYRGYSETNRMRAERVATDMARTLNTLNQLYEKELKAWIDSIDTEDRCEYLEESRLIRTRVVSENRPIYGERLDLLALNARFDDTEREMRDIFAMRQDDRRRAKAALVDRALLWYNSEMKRMYGDQQYIHPKRLGEIHEELVAKAVTRFEPARAHLPIDIFPEFMSETLRVPYNSLADENYRNAPAVPAIGIDLGTTNSCVAYYMPDRLAHSGRIKVCPNGHNDWTPSCVEYRDKGEVVVGEEAKNNLLGSPHKIIYSAKRLIGRQFVDEKVKEYKTIWPFDVVDIKCAAGVEVEVDGHSRQLLPEEVSADVLRTMKEVAERDLGHPVFDAVITVPAYFTDGQREATKAAGIIAGLNILGIINEPTAAALAYKLDRFDDMSSRNVLIYDFGGGTFDVSILKMSMGSVDVLAVGGDNDLGGDDIDNNIIDYCLREFYAQTGLQIDKRTAEGYRAMRSLRQRCERAKWNLSQSKSTTITVDNIADGRHLVVDLTRAKFDELNKDLFDRTMECVTRALKSVNKNAGISPDEIDNIVLVGGSTYIPYVQDMIKRFFNGRQPSQTVNPMLAVAEGAALKAAILNGNESRTLRNLRVLDATPRSLGTQIIGDELSIIIPRNTPVDGIPLSKGYVTTCDNQTSMIVDVFEGEDPVATHNRLLGKFTVNNIPAAKAGKEEVKVKFCVNFDGILKVTATVLSNTSDPSYKPHEYEVTEHKGRLSMAELLERRRRQ
ncbi:unnamed protein product [Medioppia subpectinata]|uniref:Guanylate-binding protein N-terminal domain-containing protein n=1 Tax=Medioppia subpectinata TaxID=1979941 RepID=A0A7R9KFS9_9ACAR|nr:unnamed protein product [Medioppia subpectinata]CAG2101386.1 unnamed protein product [Medioppia subpectinata]